MRPDEAPRPVCLWVDEFAQEHAQGADAKGADFRQAHAAFVTRRCASLAKAEVRRRAQLVPLPSTWHGMPKAERRENFAQFMLQRAWDLHQHAQNHSIDPTSGKRVSFGLIRMANIDPLFDVALAMFRHGSPEPGVRIHLCVYHSQFPLLTRSNIEHALDTVLNRRPVKTGEGPATDPALTRGPVRDLLARHPEAHHLFIVLGSPVTEVGRDHDYDWAVVEPSSMRSLIQLAGRIRRHRRGAVEHFNMAVLDCNLRNLEEKPKTGERERARYTKPGFELDAAARFVAPEGKIESTENFHLQKHLLSEVLPELAGADNRIDARPRIVVREKPNPQKRMVDLEHLRMADTMLSREASSRFFTPVKRDATLHWASPESLWLTGVLPQFQRFRYDPQPRVDVAFLPDDDEEELILYRVDDGSSLREKKLYVPIQSQISPPVPESEVRGERITPWMQLNLLAALQRWAEHQDQSLRRSAEKAATASLPQSAAGWRFHPSLGFNKK